MAHRKIVEWVVRTSKNTTSITGCVDDENRLIILFNDIRNLFVLLYSCAIEEYKPIVS